MIACIEVVYLYGGIYLDTDTICHNSFDDYNDLFRWPFVSYTLGGYNNLCNGIFSFGRGSPFLKFAMVTLASAARGLLPLFLECPLPLTQTSKVVDLL